MVQFACTIRYVQDVAAAVAFYEQALGPERKSATPDYAGLLTGSPTPAFAPVPLAKTNPKRGFVKPRRPTCRLL